MGFVVELCGLPGAGKSTLVRTIVARLRLDGTPTFDVMAALGPDASRGARLSRKVVAVARGALGPGALGVARAASARQDLRDRLARPANLLVVRAAVGRARGVPGVHLLDQGPVQEWWSAALRGDRDRVLAAAGRDPAPRSDLLVHVATPVDVLVERLGARTRRESRLERLDAADRRAALLDGAAVLEVLIDQRVHSSGSRRPGVIRVDGADPAAEDIVIEAVRREGER